MDTLLSIAMARAAERSLALVAGILAIWMGYRLFLALPQRKEGETSLNLPGGISIVLSRIGPGTLFALFGAGLIAYSVVKPVTYEEETRRLINGKDVVAASVAVETKRRIMGATEQSTAEDAKSTSECGGICISLVLAMQELNAQAAAAPDEAAKRTIQETKFRLLAMIWEPDDMGDFDAFRTWAASSPRPDAPKLFQRMADIFDAKR